MQSATSSCVSTGRVPRPCQILPALTPCRLPPHHELTRAIHAERARMRSFGLAHFPAADAQAVIGVAPRRAAAPIRPNPDRSATPQATQQPTPIWVPCCGGGGGSAFGPVLRAAGPNMSLSCGRLALAALTLTTLALLDHGIPCRLGYHALWDTMPCGMREPLPPPIAAITS
jgi:hypothetical protein